MLAVLQRVSDASVTVDGHRVAAIGPGLCILLGIVSGDDEAQIDKAVEKIIHLRIFADHAGKMNRSLIDSGGEMLIVSQFTLSASVKKGRRPSFDAAADPKEAERLYRYFIDRCAKQVKVRHGIFGAQMQVTITNDGPVTILIDTQAL